MKLKNRMSTPWWDVKIKNVFPLPLTTTITTTTTTTITLTATTTTDTTTGKLVHLATLTGKSNKSLENPNIMVR